jgi:2'-5' RNA ligase
MPYAITLPLDDAAAGHINRMWRALAEQTGDDSEIRLGYSPHITLTILADTAPVGEIEDIAFRVARDWEALSVTLAGVGVFPGVPPVIWAAPTVTQQLLAIHASLYAALASLPVHPHYQPAAWVPHVTLTKENQAPAARSIEAVTSVWEGPITARLERIELVKFRPVEILRSEALRSKL